MELKWIEDFLSVAETLNFSRSAKLRNVTQPAFSRRIRALENWLGADLFDRASYPTRLTPAGETFLAHARQMLDQTTHSRSVLRGQATDNATVMHFAMPHTLSLTYFPQWLAEIEQKVGMMSVRLAASNVHDAVMALVDGNCDILMCYHHPHQSLELDSQRYAMLALGKESLRPYSKPDANGRPRHALPGSPSKPQPFLCYSPNTSLGRIIEKSLDDAPQPVHLFRRFEADLAESLKMMAIQGHGIAWLPGSAVTQDLADGKLTLAIDPQTPLTVPHAVPWSSEMNIRLYRDRERSHPLIDRLWQHLSRLYPDHDQTA